MSTESERITGELDAVQLGSLLQQDLEALEPVDVVTVTLEREQLLELLEEATGSTGSGPQVVTLAHTVPREQLASSRNMARFASIDPDDPDLLDTDLTPSISPLLVLGVIGLLLCLFLAAMRAG